MDGNLHCRDLHKSQAPKFQESPIAHESGGWASTRLREHPGTQQFASTWDHHWHRLLGQPLLELCLALLGGVICGFCIGFFFVWRLGFPGGELLGYVSGLFFLAGLKFGFCVWLIQMIIRAVRWFL